MIRRRQSGDTIIEVLISIAVISLVLVGAYASTLKSTAITQDTLERTQAQKLVQGQIEFLRSAGSISPGNCFSSTGAVMPISNVACQVTVSGGGAVYKLDIEAAPSAAYGVSATWDSVAGGISTVTMYYRPT